MKLLLLSMIFVLTIISCSSIETKVEDKNLKGMYSYMADAAIFVDCTTNKKYPVAFEADNAALEKAYMKVRKNSGENIIVTLAGHFSLRDKMDGKGKEENLIVTKFDKIWPRIDCVRNLGTAKLKNTFWNLIELNGESIKNYKLKKNIHLLIQNDNSIKGFSGCNNFFGNSFSSNDTLKFSQIGSTLMMCANSNVEQKFNKVLEKTNMYEIYGEFLYLYNKEKLLAVFESVYFN